MNVLEMKIPVNHKVGLAEMMSQETKEESVEDKILKCPAPVMLLPSHKEYYVDGNGSVRRKIPKDKSYNRTMARNYQENR